MEVHVYVYRPCEVKRCWVACYKYLRFENSVTNIDTRDEDSAPVRLPHVLPVSWGALSRNLVHPSFEEHLSCLPIDTKVLVELYMEPGSFCWPKEKGACLEA